MWIFWNCSSTKKFPGYFKLLENAFYQIMGVNYVTYAPSLHYPLLLRRVSPF